MCVCFSLFVWVVLGAGKNKFMESGVSNNKTLELQPAQIYNTDWSALY